jgi:hypothetical protein
VSQYTQEDRNRLMAWLNETRHWHFNETLTKLEEEEKEHSTAVQRVAADETATLENDAMRQTEKELNVYGASIEKSYNAITRSVELMMTSDILVNQSKYLEHEHELAGGMNPDIIPQFEQARYPAVFIWRQIKLAGAMLQATPHCFFADQSGEDAGSGRARRDSSGGEPSATARRSAARL